MKKFFQNFDPWGCGILLFLIIIATFGLLTSCCTNVCKQGAPELRPMPDSRSQDMLPYGVYVIEDIIEIPVEHTTK